MPAILRGLTKLATPLSRKGPPFVLIEPILFHHPAQKAYTGKTTSLRMVSGQQPVIRRLTTWRSCQKGNVLLE